MVLCSDCTILNVATAASRELAVCSELYILDSQQARQRPPPAGYAYLRLGQADRHVVPQQGDQALIPLKLENVFPKRQTGPAFMFCGTAVAAAASPYSALKGCRHFKFCSLSSHPRVAIGIETPHNITGGASFKLT